MKVEEYLKKGTIEYDPDFQYIWIKLPDNDKILLCDIRGWGYLSKIFPIPIEAREFQDNIAKFIIDAINEKLNKT